MVRNWDTIREILICIESLPCTWVESSTISNKLSILGLSPEQIRFHLELLSDQDIFLEHQVDYRQNLDIFRLTWDGAELVDKLKPVENMNIIRDWVEKTGGLPLKVLAQLGEDDDLEPFV